MYKKINNVTVKLTSSDKTKLENILEFIQYTSDAKSIEEQIENIEIFDSRLIDTSKIKIRRIDNKNINIEIGMSIKDNDVYAEFFNGDKESNPDEYKAMNYWYGNFLERNDWKFLKVIDGYEIYVINNRYVKVTKNDVDYYIYVNGKIDLNTFVDELFKLIMK